MSDSEQTRQHGSIGSRAFFDAAPCGFIVVGRDWRISEANATLADWMKEDAAALRGRHLRDLLDVGGRIFFDTHFAPLMRLQGAFHEVALNLKRADGTRMATLVNAAEHLDEDGAVDAMLVTIFNATDRRRYEDELVAARNALRELNEKLEERVRTEVESRLATENILRQAQKMEAVGNLSGGIAHDFNNILQIVSANLGLLAKRVSKDAASYVENAQAGVDRGAQLAQQLLAFGRKTPMLSTVADATTIVAGMQDMIARTIGSEVDVAFDLPDAQLPVEIDASQLENAILNLAINARDAMADGEGPGELFITARAVDAGSSQLPEGATGPHIEICVRDTGEGMDAETVAKVFEPFFTTKAAGKGTGLGLAMVYSFARQSGGQVVIRSAPGRGTSISIWIPRSEKPISPDASAVREIEVRGGTETVLLVEDNEAVRGATRILLDDLGYTVLEASGDEEAHRHLAGPLAIDLAIFNLVLRGSRDGMELVRTFREQGYGGGLLMTSGHADEFDDRLDRSIELLRKPYDRTSLAAAVRRALGAGIEGAPRPERAAAASLPQTEEVSHDNCTVLLVEDEVLIRISTADQLTDLGHTVFQAGTGADALDIIERESIDAMLVDLGLPDISGEELARTVRHRHPEIGIAFATGARDIPELEGAPTAQLDKPYGADDLIAVLAKLTGG